MKKIYIVVETTQDYKGVHTTIWGSSESMETAEATQKEAIRFLTDNNEDAYKKGMKNGEWVRDDGDMYQRVSIVVSELRK